METKLEKINERLASIDSHLAVYNEQLKHHIRRTELLEQKMEHVDSHVKVVNGIVKFLLGLAGITTLFKYFRGP